jgi:hypothetical protein
LNRHAGLPNAIDVVVFSDDKGKMMIYKVGRVK